MDSGSGSLIGARPFSTETNYESNERTRVRNPVAPIREAEEHSAALLDDWQAIQDHRGRGWVHGVAKGRQSEAAFRVPSHAHGGRAGVAHLWLVCGWLRSRHGPCAR